jgi:hypothetical protein
MTDSTRRPPSAGRVIPMHRGSSLPHRVYPHLKPPVGREDRVAWWIERQLSLLLDEYDTEQALALLTEFNPGLNVAAVEELLELSETASDAERAGRNGMFYIAADHYSDALHALARRVAKSATAPAPTGTEACL